MKETIKKYKNVILTVVLVLGLTVGGIAIGASNGFGWLNIENVENLTISSPGIPNIENDFSLGATFSEIQTDLRLSNTDMAEVAGLSIFDRLRFGDDPLVNQNSITEKYIYKTFLDASTTVFAVQNKEGKTIYLDDWSIEVTTMPTSSLQFFIATSSTGFINSVTLRAILNPGADNSVTSLSDDILITDTTARDADGTVIWYDREFEPTDRGYGTNMSNVPILADEYIIVYASSTALANEQITADDNIFDGKIFIKYRFLE